MSIQAYKASCLTNLHMGSGDVNYNVIDLEVACDPVLGEPTMHASGVKGALRDACVQKKGLDSAEAQKDAQIVRLFGGEKDEKGTYHFFGGDLIARPVRVSKGRGAYVLATTPDLVAHVAEKMRAFGVLKQEIELPALQEDCVLCGRNGVEGVEGMDAKHASCSLLDQLIGKNWALMTAEQLAQIDLPVFAHNVLDNGISQNLWFEQMVPHESVFYLLVDCPDEVSLLDGILGADPIVQFGAGASTGCGYVKLEKWSEKQEAEHE